MTPGRSRRESILSRPDHVSQNIFVVLANELQQFGVGLKLRTESESPRFSKRLRIFYSDLDLHVPEVQALVALCDACGLRNGYAAGKRAAIIEAGGLDHSESPSQ